MGLRRLSIMAVSCLALLLTVEAFPAAEIDSEVTEMNKDVYRSVGSGIPSPMTILVEDNLIPEEIHSRSKRSPQRQSSYNKFGSYLAYSQYQRYRQRQRPRYRYRPHYYGSYYG